MNDLPVYNPITDVTEQPDPIETPEEHKNLATIQKIKSLEPIEGADKIELAKMEDLAWQVVVQKGTHKVGDLVCYIQIDTIVDPTYCNDDKYPFAFLEKVHFRIKTIKLRKQLSQGIIMPLHELGPVFEVTQCGADITKLIRVKKYEKPIPANLRGKIRGSFPTHLVPKTDEERLQNCSRILEELKDVPVYITVKMDGTSATYIHFNGDAHVCSRNMDLKGPEERTFHEKSVLEIGKELTEEQKEKFKEEWNKQVEGSDPRPKLEVVKQDKPNVYWEMEKKYNILEKLKAKGNYAVQGEICGPGIQGNKAGLEETHLFVFNIYNIDEKRYLNFDEFQAFLNDTALKGVPIINMKFILPTQFDEALKLADGLYPNNTPREGVVIRPLIERYSDYMKGRVSFKIVSNEFLLKYSE